MSTSSSPAVSLRTGYRLPAGRALPRVSMYLICWALSWVRSSILGAVSNFLPALREAQCCRGREAARSTPLIRVFSLAQHHPDRCAGKIEFLAQRIDQILPVGVGELSRPRSEKSESRRSCIGLSD